MRYWRWVFSLLLAWSVAAGAAITDELSPWPWINRFVPEDVPANFAAPAYFTKLDLAREQVNRGLYKRALYTLYEHQASADEQKEVNRLRSECLLALGNIEEALQAAAGDQALRVRILINAGQLDEAASAAAAHLKDSPDSIAAHYWLGHVAELRGDMETAGSAYGWFAEPARFILPWQSRRESFERADELVLIGRALDRWAILTGAYAQNRPLHDAILAMFVRAYDVLDRSCWPAHLAAAEYFLAHDDAREAGKELTAALRINSRAASVLLLRGRMAIEQYNFDAADAAVAALRQINPESPAAIVLQARALLRQRRPQSAEVLLARVLQSRPRDLEALGLLAAARALQLDEAGMNRALASVESIDANNASAYFELGEALAAMRQYPRSAAMYQKAIERAPWWTAARNGLGLLYTQSGDEDDARHTLDAAHALDPFNLRTTNYLRLLDEMASMERRQTPHFVILHDGKLDAVIGDFFADYLEEMYQQVCTAYRHEPPVKTYIEVFPTHDAFSVRTTGSPWIGTVGASTGRVIALVAPRKGGGAMGPYNWSQVLRHEFTHTVTLSATENRIPHWMTEGLAVSQEQHPMRRDWGPMLYAAAHDNTLFGVEDLTWAFIRPRRPNDRDMAYAQSYWVCRFIRERFGDEAILRMMEQFKAGGLEENVFQSVLGMGREPFAKQFGDWMREQSRPWGYDSRTGEAYEKLLERGEALIKERRYTDAIGPWQEAARLRPLEALPRQRLAGLYLSKEVNRPADAAEHLLALHEGELSDNRYAKRLARLYRQLDRPADALTMAADTVRINPYDSEALNLLAEMHEKNGDAAAAQRYRQWAERMK